jgi:hypothetical protein
MSNGMVRADAISQFKNPICAWPLRTLNDPEANFRPLLEALMGLGLDGAVVDEDECAV